ncbi:MAG: PIN domain-containing protein [Chloroflexi bacterium]|nr:PIN domain-containing protein [Chloroflexota bacterium]MBM3154375.1 PIN domain-containing protein [Chloroflexota bacterium]MBM3172131.1 PIN domain-containing protein [Chloroflexota bacterium]MBM3174592.1 PIN domain-containing protein [Chloroflexota bacterium]MBM4449352.1 PIN domain-containing protein [Chloroflexota bacterium]
MAEPVFIDTNILVYASNEDSLHHAKAKAVIQSINDGDLPACLSTQVLAEFFATVTNSRKVARPLKPGQAAEAVEGYLDSDILKLAPNEDILRLTLALAEQHQVIGPDIFDAQIVATMLQNRVRTIYTANTDDFKKYSEIKTVNPLD